MEKKTHVTATAVNEQSSMQNLTEKQLAVRWQLSVKTLQAQRWKGVHCPYLKVGRLVRYRLVDVLHYEQANLHLEVKEQAHG